ncbi:cache domain-containing protein [uncultured Luteimonas sp.]|uniref:sensor histidine kinase n=1 Tax=uncultured Luteimonas sp. TaxID=453144 RepID=UPI002630173B|nr:cache domain-containing protein [uncultured Luteimonas sp.]
MPTDRTAPPTPGRSLLGQFTALVLLAVFLPVLVLAGVLLWQSSMSVRSQGATRLAATADASARELDSFLRAHLAALQVLADRRNAAGDIGDLARWDADLARVNHYYPAFAHLLVTDADARVLTSAPPLPVDAVASVADREYFRMPRRTGQGHVSSVYRGRGPDNGARIAISVPLYRDGQFAGVLVGSMQADALVPVRGLEENGFELLLLDRGLTVVQASAGLQKRPLDQLAAGPDPGLARVARTLDGVQELDAVLRGGEDALAVAAPVDNGWRLLLLQPSGVVEAELRRTAAAVLALLVLVLTGVLAVVVAKMRRLGGSVRGLLRRMRQFALDGDTTQLAPANLPRELLPLADAMNGLATRARASFDEVNLSLQEQRRLREELQSVAQRLLTVQEDERRTLSRELHDDIGQSITAIKLAATSLTDDALADEPAVRREILDEIIAIADQTVLKLRNLSLLLRPPQLDSLGLEAALRGQVALLSRNSALEIRLEVAPLEARLPPDAELACFRIAQEALTNVARHAGATRVEVEVEVEDGDRGPLLVLRVSDDGRGFDAAHPAGLGLVTMRERATQLGGSVTIASRAGGGTVVRAVLPLAAGKRAPRT